ncbi:MAG: nucleoside hydrolase [bacterium]|nr:nucleoside hydrolase [bacterium]
MIRTIAGVAVGMWLGMSGAMARDDVPNIIFDTDMTGDCDDCGALAVLHALADNGEVEILGCIASWGANPYVAGCIDAINTYYGRGDLPIGAEHRDLGRPDSRYVEPIAKDTARYGHSVVTNQDVPDPVSVYRRLLAEQPDGSVTIVTVGRLGGLHDLMTSKPDAFSELGGMSLVKQKVQRWVCMGGRYPNDVEQREANFCSWGGSEYTKKVVEGWPLPVAFSGYEIGAQIMTGPALLKQSDDNPVARAYRLFFQASKGEKKPDSRQSWDQTAVLYAVRGADPWWDVVSTGYNHILEDGMNQWRPSPDKNHAYLVKRRPPEEVTNLISGLMVQPPKARAGR